VGYTHIDEVTVDPRRARVHEHGWQSWSPTTTYPAGATSARPRDACQHLMRFRPGSPLPGTGFQAEGLLAVDTGTAAGTVVYAAGGPDGEVPSIRARLHGDHLVVRATGPVEVTRAAGGLGSSLADQGDRLRPGVTPRRAPTVWCTWYQYFVDVTQEDVLENLRGLDEHDLPVDVVQVDDGWQAAVGDWTDLSGRFSSLAGLVEQIRGSGRRAGIWVAPFIAGERSSLARTHPDWLTGDAGRNWGQRLSGVDLTHPGARDHLFAVLRGLRDLGFDYFKLDFLYGGALPGRRHQDASPVAAYRSGMRLVRRAVGEESYLLGCGAPMLPSIGLVDAMRVSSDAIDPTDPGDPAGPGEGAEPLRGQANIEARAWQHGRLWVNDADCLVARPSFPRRVARSALIERYGGLRSSSDRIADLDDWGLETTRRLLRDTPPPTPFARLPADHPRPVSTG
jgi:alpha-galactosidase